MTYLLHIVIMIGITLPNILGFNMVFGKGKIFHFGPMGLSLVSAYAAFVTLMHTDNYVAAIAMSLLCTMLLCAVLAWLAVRLPADGLGVLTIAVHLILLTIVLNWTDVTRGALGIPGIRRMPFLTEQWAFALATTVIAILWILFLLWIERGPFGRKLTALAEHDWHAQSIGVNRTAVMFGVFVISGIGSVLTNILYPQYVYLLYPSDYSYPFFVFFAMCVVAGKPGNVLGVTVSTILLMTLKEGLRFVPMSADLIGPLRLLLFGVILLVAVFVQRDTLFPQKRSI